jgi:hypothetical protein
VFIVSSWWLNLNAEYCLSFQSKVWLDYCMLVCDCIQDVLF